jgi:hypothetical protein
MVFLDLWVGRAVTTTLASKFGSPAQRWGRAGLGRGGAATKLWAPVLEMHTCSPPTFPPKKKQIKHCPYLTGYDGWAYVGTRRGGG